MAVWRERDDDFILGQFAPAGPRSSVMRRGVPRAPAHFAQRNTPIAANRCEASAAADACRTQHKRVSPSPFNPSIYLQRSAFRSALAGTALRPGISRIRAKPPADGSRAWA